MYRRRAATRPGLEEVCKRRLPAGLSLTDVALPGTGNADSAFAWLEKALAQDARWINRIDTDLYGKIKSDPRWAALQARYRTKDDYVDWKSATFNPLLPAEVRERIAAARDAGV